MVVFRNTIGLQLVGGLTLGLNFLFVVLASRLLDIESFGVLYLSISLVSILFSPSAAVNLVLFRHFFHERERFGDPGGVAALRSALKATFMWGGLVSVLAFLVFLAMTSVIKIESPLMLALVVATAYMSYPADVARAYLQARREFSGLARFNAAWMAARFALSLLGVVATGHPWGGLAGIIASTMLMLIWFGWRHAGQPADAHLSVLPSPRTAWTLAGAYAVLSLLQYLDVLLAWLTQDPISFGGYSAATVFPKAIVVLAMPLAQVAFSIFLERRAKGQGMMGNIAKASFLTAVIVLLAIGSTILAIRMGLCGAGGVVAACPGDLGETLVWTALPLSLVRLLATAQFARGADWHPFTLLVPVMAFAAFWLVGSRSSGLDLASAYTLFCWVAFGWYVLLLAIGRARAKAAAS